MGTSLTGLTPATTYDALIKVGDNGPLSATAKYIGDGLGNDSALALSTTAVGIGTSSPNGKTTIIGDTVDIRNTVGSYGTGYAIEISTNANIPRVNFIDNGVYTGVLKSSSGLVTLTNQSNNSISFETNGANERFRITNNGVTFNGDTAAANALDDYEEGTWTMGIAFGGASAGVTTSSNTGSYTKIGRQVTVNGYLALTSKGSSVGDAVITGLPFTIANGNQFYAAASLRLRNITFTNQFQGLGDINATTILLEEVTILGTRTALTDADFANNSEIMVNFTYFV